MENREFKNSISGKKDINESFLATATSARDVRKYWKQLGGLSDAEIEKRTKEYQETLDRIIKATKRFVYLVEKKYSYLDDPELVKKAIKYSKKHELSNIETQILIKFVLKKGEISLSRWPLQEIQHTEMSKFLGYSEQNDRTIMPSEAEKPDFNKLIELYEHSKTIHAVVKNQLVLYQDCAPEVLLGKYDPTRHSNSFYIHPVIAALYIPKIDSLEKRTLWSNIGRMILSNTPLYLGRQLSNQEIIVNNERDADRELSYAIAMDPNSLPYVNNETPLSNLIKRFKIQIELWKNVHNLRQGKFFSSGEYDVDDSITGFLKILNSYNWAYYDSPDMYQIQDEGTVLRKFLATFSIRPTVIQLSSPTINWAGPNNFQASNYLNASKISFINTPVLNLRLPASITDPNNNLLKFNSDLVQGLKVSPEPEVKSLSLSNAESQHDIFWENRTPVIKSKQVLFSNDVAFYYVNRKYQHINLLTNSVDMRYLELTNNFNISGITQVNTTPINVVLNDYQIGKFNRKDRVGKDMSNNFNLRSVVVVQSLPNQQFITTGCSAYFIKRSEREALFCKYDPQRAGISALESATSGTEPQYTTQQPIVQRNQDQFIEEIQTLGTIYFYESDSS